MLFLDSAHVEDARRAAWLGLIQGVTTNPMLKRADGAGQVRRLRDDDPAGPDQDEPGRGIDRRQVRVEGRLEVAVRRP